MDESLVDIVLILLATLVAISVVPTFEIEPPVSQEATVSELSPEPLQVAILDDGSFLTPNEEGIPESITPADFYVLLVGMSAEQTIEFTADKDAPAAFMINANKIVQKTGKKASFIVKYDTSEQ